MRVNINNVESIKVNNREEAIDIIKEKMKAWMQEGDYLGWYKSESNFNEPDIAAVYNKFHEETNSFARIIG
jgi:hypothetical protein